VRGRDQNQHLGEVMADLDGGLGDGETIIALAMNNKKPVDVGQTKGKKNVPLNFSRGGAVGGRGQPFRVAPASGGGN